MSKKLVMDLNLLLIILTPVYISMIESFSTFSRIAIIFMLVITIIIQILHYKKTKKVNYEMRILIFLVVFIFGSWILNACYMNIKNLEAKRLIKKIDKISYEVCARQELNKEYPMLEIESDQFKLEYIIDAQSYKLPSNKAIIYYKDGTTEITVTNCAAIPKPIKIKKDIYYINNQ